MPPLRIARRLAAAALAVLPLVLSGCCTCTYASFIDDDRTNITVTGAATFVTGGSTLPITTGSLEVNTSATTMEMTGIAVFGVSTDGVPTKTPPALPFYSSKNVSPTGVTLGGSEMTSAPAHDTGVASKYLIWVRIEGIDTSTSPSVPLTLFAYRSAEPTAAGWGTAAAFTILE